VPAPVSFSANGTNAAKNTTATFTAAGNYNFTVTITNQSGLSAVSSVSVPVTLGIFNNSADIGSPALAGSLSYNASSGAYTVKAGGADIWGSSDQFRYTYTTFNVNAQITARVTSVSNTSSSAKAGVMFRDSAAANAAYAFAWVSPSNQVTFETRSSNGATASYTVSLSPGGSPVWVRLIRNGSSSNQFSAYYSLNGTSWTQVGTTQTVTMSSAYLAGLAVTSHNTTTLNTSVIDNASVNGLNTRGWATLNAARTTFVADNGQLLRSPFTSTEGGTATTEADIAAMKNLGFNAIHLYVEGADGNYPNPGSNTPGYEALAADKIVQYCQDLGLYCIIVAGGSERWIDDLWQFYAPRYANYSNVIYEIANEPAGDITMAVNEACYSTIRTYAPNTPVLVFTPCNVYGTGGGDSAVQDIHTFNQAEFGNPNAVWTNIAYAFHGYAPTDLTTAGVQTILNAGYPVFMTEANGSTFDKNSGGIDIQLTQWLEEAKISWVVFVHTPAPFYICAGDVTDPDQYVNPVNESGLSWTPDFGTWPAVRGAYDTGSVPWNTTNTFDSNNQLTGTLHIEAENYDWGGQNLSYYDTTPGNQGGQYRTDDVDISTTNDIDGGFAISSTANGEWFEYTINVPEPGYYNLGLRYSNATAGATVDVSSVRDGDMTGPLTLPTTGGLSNWSTLSTQVFLGGGQQILKISVPAGGFNLNWLELTPITSGPVSSGTYLIVNRNSGLALQLNTSTSNVEQQPLASSSTTQQWNLQSLGAGQYKVISANNGSYWTFWMKSSLGTGADWSATNILLRPIGNGYYRVGSSGGLAFEPQNNSTSAGALITQDVFSSQAGQEWTIVATTDQIFPTGLSAFCDSAGKAQLSWTVASGAGSYNVKRATTSGGPYTTIATGVTVTGYVDASVSANTTYYYVVSAVSSAGKESINSTEAGVQTSSLPAPRALLKFDEGAGTTAADATGHGWTGTLQNGATWSSGAIGSAVSLDGVNDYVSLPTGIVNGLTDFTISAWVNLAANSTWARIFDFGTGTNVNMFLTANPSNSNTLRFAITTGGSWSEQQINGNVQLSLNTWYQVAVTLAGGVGTLYVNGQAVGTNTSMTLKPSSLGATNQNYLGKSQYNDPYFSGKIDDFRIYASALSSGAIASLYKSQSVPGVAAAASATPSTVTGTTTNLSVLGSDSAGESNLTYTWSTTGTPPAPVTFSANGANTAKNTIATFSRTGTYNFLVSITNASGLMVCSSVAVTVNQAPTGVSVLPSSTAVTINTTKQFSATEYDQFGVALSTQPTFTWTIASGGGSISTSGLYTAPATAGPAAVQAAAGSISSTASVNVTTQSAPTIVNAAAASPSPAGTSTALSVLGSSSAGETNLIYTWSLAGTPPASVVFSSNGTNASKSTTATFTKPGAYNFTVTITDQVGLSITSSVSVPVTFGIFTDSGDIGSPALAGSLSYNASSGAYTVKAGGSDIWNSSDQFRYNYTAFSGDSAIIAHVTSISSGSDGWAKAGPMFRDSAAAGAVFADVVATPGNGVSFQWRSSTGGGCGYAQTTGITAPVWLKLVRSGNSFSAYYSTNGTSWTQVGSTQTITMATSALAGLAVTSHNASALTTAVVDHVSLNAIPTVATAAWATPMVIVTGKNAQLTVLGADNAGESNLTYAWSMTSGPAAVTYSANGTNAAKTTMATFTKAGSYTFLVTITNAGGLSTTSSVSVTVNQTLTTINVTPATVALPLNGTKQFSASALDQFGMVMSPQPSFTWSKFSGVGSINSSTGLYTAPGTAGNAAVRAASGSVIGTANVTIANTAPTIATHVSASPNPVIGSKTALSVLGADDGGEANLTYTWTTTGTPPAPVTFTRNGNNTAKNTIARFTQSGTYTLKVTVTDNGGLSTEDSITISVTYAPETYTWDGGSTVDSNWTTPENWSGDVAPQAGDNLVFPAGAARLENVNDYPAGTVFGSINVSGSGYVFQGNAYKSSMVNVQPNTNVEANSIYSDTLTIGAGSVVTIAPIPGGPLAANSALTPLATDALLLNQPKTVTQPTAANTIVSSLSTTTTIAAGPLAASTVLASPAPASSEVASALTSSDSLSNTVLNAVAISTPISIVADSALPVRLVESTPVKIVDTAINRLLPQSPIYFRLDSTALHKIIESGLEQSLTTRNGNITSTPILNSLRDELPLSVSKFEKHPTTSAINSRQALFAALQTVVRNSRWTDLDAEADFDIAQHVRAGKHTKQLEKAVDTVLAEEDAIFVEI
jgi:hypothetical protein